MTSIDHLLKYIDRFVSILEVQNKRPERRRGFDVDVVALWWKGDVTRTMGLFPMVPTRMDMDLDIVNEILLDCWLINMDSLHGSESESVVTMLSDLLE